MQIKNLVKISLCGIFFMFNTFGFADYYLNYKEEFFRDSFRRYFPKNIPGTSYLSAPPIDENEPDKIKAEAARQAGMSVAEYELALEEKISQEREEQRQYNRKILEESDRYQNEVLKSKGLEPEPTLKDSTRNMTDAQRVEAYKKGLLQDEKYIKDLQNKSASELESLYGDDTANLAREISLQKLKMFNTASGELMEGEELKYIVVLVVVAILVLGVALLTTSSSFFGDAKEKIMKGKE